MLEQNFHALQVLSQLYSEVATEAKAFNLLKQASSVIQSEEYPRNYVAIRGQAEFLKKICGTLNLNFHMNLVAGELTLNMEPTLAEYLTLESAQFGRRIVLTKMLTQD